jgi:hypothetical protein
MCLHHKSVFKKGCLVFPNRAADSRYVYHIVSLVAVQAKQHPARGTQLPQSFVGVGNGALWAVNGTVQSFGAVLKTLKVFALLHS